MQIPLNGATTMRADLETDIRAAGEARFEWLEIWASKLRAFLESNRAADLNTLFAEQNVRPYSINSMERITFRTDDEHRRLLVECDAALGEPLDWSLHEFEPAAGYLATRAWP